MSNTPRPPVDYSLLMHLKESDEPPAVDGIEPSTKERNIEIEETLVGNEKQHFPVGL
jgi:hypothetical protein